MRKIIHIDGVAVSLKYQDLPEEIDVDEITSIDYSNIYGEVVTTPVILNQVGQWKASFEKEFETQKVKLEIYEAKFKKKLRRQAARGGKFKDGGGEVIKGTEDAYEEELRSDKEWQKLKFDLIDSKKDLGIVDSLHWAISSKDRKLNNMIKQVTPKEFIEELVEGKLNGIIIKKGKSLSKNK